MSGETSPERTDAPSGVVDRLERIRQARRARAAGAAAVVLVVGFLFVQALSAVDFFTESYQWDFFAKSLRDFFPITLYAGWIPFLDVQQYWAFISDRNLIFDPASFQALLTDPIGFLFGSSLGIFSIFGEAGVTLAIGFAGTVLGFPLALVFGVLGSERVIPFPFNFLFRSTMSGIRSIPALVWALIYIPLVGLTPLAALLAVGTDTIGNLGRLFTDELEEIEDGPIEAMQTTGASRPQVIVFGMLSQVRTSFVAWTLYILEINVRVAVSLGIIGAGGLGEILDVQQGLFQFTNAMATLLCIFLLIISVELFSQRVRSRLRSDDEPMGVRELLLGLPQRLIESLAR
ncbi:phosphonate ABC transporter, permease protein PhnE [Natrinema longum]|uniref:Phosphonate ABC transporter, permease protein PhnE n=1 Tax=Natrinema longum TaxID=370324 RepID=A0A8A2UE57_9EURY|nr:phosphonate ABC transporter, permease protein PhnE [Natrinema longum]MBZ6495279.1 phosphonate ABC transporter, permease protein PhnE [Natrinema longum]QSW86742.1 phosphonate ABC transporter, permease protein PhnE [Natrinema longum]